MSLTVGEASNMYDWKFYKYVTARWRTAAGSEKLQQVWILQEMYHKAEILLYNMKITTCGFNIGANWFYFIFFFYFLFIFSLYIIIMFGWIQLNLYICLSYLCHI